MIWAVYAVRDGRGRRSAVPGSRSGRRELLIVLLLGAAGAGLVLLSVRHGWAHVTTRVPKPLPSSVVTLTGQDLVPAASPLAVAALAGLAAVIATRRVLRRATGVVLAAFGVGMAAALSLSISAADMLAVAAGGAGPAGGAAAGAAPGSTSAGVVRAGQGTPVSGLHDHAVLADMPWRGAAFAGAALVVAAGILVTWRAGGLPVMSSRYEPPVGDDAPGRAAGRVGQAAGDPGAGDSAGMWESLSRGEDPTTQPGRDPGQAGNAMTGQAGHAAPGRDGNTAS
jgi:uncharacterized membrane protein (TIGR02234 family)